MVVFSVLVIAMGCSHRTGSSADTDTDRYAEFIAGFSLLTAAEKNKPDSINCQRFRDLTTLTGLTADSVEKFLRTLRTDPEKGKTFYTEMSRLNENRPDTLTR